EDLAAVSSFTSGSTIPPALDDSGLDIALTLSPSKEVVAGSLLRATVTARNGGPERLSFHNVTLRYQFSQLAYESAESDRILVTSYAGDSTTFAYRRIDPGETVAATLLFRVRDTLGDGTVISMTPEYICGGDLCTGNLAEAQVGAATAGLERADDTQELLVAPVSGGPETIFRFSSQKFTRRDTVWLWLGSNDGGVRQLPQEYHVGDDGWVHFELDGASVGVGIWNLLAYGSLSGYTSIASFTVSDSAPNGLAQAELAARAGVARVPALSGGASAAPPPAATPAQQPATGGIAGAVTDAATGAGVPEVLVVALRDGVPIASALTRASGVYLIPTGLATGSYEVRALAASAGSALAYQDALYAQPVQVTAPDLVAGINIALARGGTIAGRVTASDTRGGLAGVTVEALGAGDVVLGSGATAADGSYQIEGLPQGAYSVRLSPATGDDGDVVAYAGTTVSAVAVTVGATAFVDVGLSLRPTAAAIRGQVSGPGGGLPAVIVAVFDAENDLVDLTMTEADGRYATGPLANGSYRVAFVTFFSENASTRRHVSAYYANSATYAGATPVTINGPGVVENINAALTLGGSIGGTVTGTAGTILADVLVAAFDANGAVRAVGRSGADGAYSLTGLDTSAYKVGFFAEYAASAAVRGYVDTFYSGKASFADADAVSVTAGATTTGINGALAPGGAIGGLVTDDDDGSGLGGVVVVAFGQAGGIAAVTVTDETGAYQTPALAPGSYTVLFDTILASVEATRGYLDEYFDNRSEAPYTALTVAVGTTTTANAGLALGGQIAGRVTAADSDLGLSGVAVLVFSGNTLVGFTVTDQGGEYTTAGLPAGDYTLQFDPRLSANQETEQYAAQVRLGTVSVAVGATTANVDAALTRP
ncbi:MAG: hypothetical protein HGA45_35620, partial [Chloroflexales bacterium]|nr:hypothetical protein [Chloroflexales bacterium]